MTRPEARWLKPPRFRTDDGPHRQATWLELFFDLVFVVTVAGLASLLREDLTWTGLAWFAFLFWPAWWLWTDWSYYGDQFDTDDAIYRLAVLAAMFGVLAIAHIAPRITDGRAAWGSLVFAGLYAILAALYARAVRPNPEIAPIPLSYAVVMGLAAALWAVSALVPPPWRYSLWAATVLAVMAHSPIVHALNPDRPTQVSHMPERFGLFAIVALGESTVAVSAGVEEVGFSPTVLVAALAGFALAASIWWVFFVRDDPSAMSAEIAGRRGSILRSHVYGYAHCLLYVGIVAASVGAEEAILALDAGDGGGAGPEEGGSGAHGGGHAFGPVARAALAGGAAVAILGTAIVHRAAARPLPARAVASRLGAAGVLAALAASPLGPLATLVAAALVATLLALAETALLPHPDALPDEAGEGRGETAR